MSSSVPPAVYDAARLAAVRSTGLLDTGAEEPFDRLARLASALLETPFAFVTVVDERRSFWKACIGVDSTDLAERQNAVGDSFCQYVVGSGDELIVGDTAHDARTRDNPSNESMGVAAWAGFPVRSPEGQVLGTFCVVDTRIRDWTPRDVTILETLAHAASGEVGLRIALQEAHVAEEEARSQEQAHKALAQTLQESLLPAQLRAVPGLRVSARYTPGEGGVRVLGDFYDLFPAHGEAWGALVGDVTGHGAPAAALTALARWTVRAHASRSGTPSQVLSELNTVMLNRSRLAAGADAERFLTAAYLTLHPEGAGPTGLTDDPAEDPDPAGPDGTGEMSFRGTICLAGHPPVLHRAGDGTVSPLGTPGSLVGVLETPILHDDQFTLAPGESLVLYTDGVTEARRDGGGEQFGEERLAQLVAEHGDAADLAERIEHAVRQYSGTSTQDDIAIVVITAGPGDGLIPVDGVVGASVSV